MSIRTEKLRIPNIKMPIYSTFRDPGYVLNRRRKQESQKTITELVYGIKNVTLTNLRCLRKSFKRKSSLKPREGK